MRLSQANREAQAQAALQPHRMEKEIEREDLFTSGAKADFRGRLSDIVANQAMQLRSSPAPSNRTPWR